MTCVNPSWGWETMPAAPAPSADKRLGRSGCPPPAKAAPGRSPSTAVRLPGLPPVGPQWQCAGAAWPDHHPEGRRGLCPAPASRSQAPRGQVEGLGLSTPEPLSAAWSRRAHLGRQGHQRPERSSHWTGPSRPAPTPAHPRAPAPVQLHLPASWSGSRLESPLRGHEAHPAGPRVSPSRRSRPRPGLDPWPTAT